MLCSIVRTLQRGIPVGFNVWVDRWPSPQAVIVNAEEEKCQVECWKKIAFVFETNTTSFISLFSDVERDTMKNKTERGYVGISPGTFEDLKAAFPQCRLSLHETQAMWLKPENHSRRKRTTCLPDGFQTGSMSRKISDMIVAHAPHFEGYISSDAIFKPATMYKCPYVVVLDKNDSPIGWYVQHCVQGSLSFLYVLPEFRGHKIGRFLVENLSDQVIERDGVAFIEVEKDNKLSIKIHEDAGYELVEPLYFVLHLPPE